MGIYARAFEINVGGRYSILILNASGAVILTEFTAFAFVIAFEALQLIGDFKKMGFAHTLKCDSFQLSILIIIAGQAASRLLNAEIARLMALRTFSLGWSLFVIPLSAGTRIFALSQIDIINSIFYN